MKDISTTLNDQLQWYIDTRFLPPFLNFPHESGLLILVVEFDIKCRSVHQDDLTTLLLDYCVLNFLGTAFQASSNFQCF